MNQNSSAFRYRLEHKKTKDFEKEEQITFIKRTLEAEFQGFLTTIPAKSTAQPSLPKLKFMYNNLLYQNSCKSAHLSDLQSKIKHFQSRFHSTPVSPNNISPDLKIKELTSELEAIDNDIQEEYQEKLLLEKMKQNEKSAVRIILERINDIEEKDVELGKYTEKVTRTSSLAGNLYRNTNRKLSSSKNKISLQKSNRNSSLKELKSKESKLQVQVNYLETDFTQRVYSSNATKTKLGYITNRIEGLCQSMKVNKKESIMSLEFIDETKLIQERLIGIVKNSKFITEDLNDNLCLHQMGKYLNILIFAETQLQLRFSELIKLHTSSKEKVEALKAEFSEIKEKFSDSEFIDNYNKKNFSSENLLKNQLNDEKPKKSLNRLVSHLEKICILSLKAISELQDHSSKLTEKINQNSQSSVKLIKPSDLSPLLRQRSLSFRRSFDTLPVLSDKKDISNFFKFRESVAYLLREKFSKTPNDYCESFLKVLTNDYILKNFLTATDINEHIKDSESAEETFLKYFILYEPAHENLRNKFMKTVKHLSSFLAGVEIVSDQIMQTFEKNSLSELQLNKLMALNPKINYTSRHLKNIVKDVLRFSISGKPEKGMKEFLAVSKISKFKEFGVIHEEPDAIQLKSAKKKVLKHSKHQRYASQQEIKSHLEGINSLLIKSSRESLIKT